MHVACTSEANYPALDTSTRVQRSTLSRKQRKGIIIIIIIITVSDGHHICLFFSVRVRDQALISLIACTSRVAIAASRSEWGVDISSAIVRRRTYRTCTRISIDKSRKRGEPGTLLEPKFFTLPTLWSLRSADEKKKKNACSRIGSFEESKAKNSEGGGEKGLGKGARAKIPRHTRALMCLEDRGASANGWICYRERDKKVPSRRVRSWVLCASEISWIYKKNPPLDDLELRCVGGVILSEYVFPRQVHFNCRLTRPTLRSVSDASTYGSSSASLPLFPSS